MCCRGVGRSSSPSGMQAYSTELMARDCLMLLVRPVHGDLPARVRHPATMSFWVSQSSTSALCSQGIQDLMQLLISSGAFLQCRTD